MQHNEEKLLKKLKRGSHDSFRTLTNYYYEEVYDYVLNYTGDQYLSDLIVKNTFSETYKYLMQNKQEELGFRSAVYRLLPGQIEIAYNSSEHSDVDFSKDDNCDTSGQRVNVDRVMSKTMSQSEYSGKGATIISVILVFGVFIGIAIFLFFSQASFTNEDPLEVIGLERVFGFVSDEVILFESLLNEETVVVTGGNYQFLSNNDLTLVKDFYEFIEKRDIISNLEYYVLDETREFENGYVIENGLGTFLIYYNYNNRFLDGVIVVGDTVVYFEIELSGGSEYEIDGHFTNDDNYVHIVYDANEDIVIVGVEGNVNNRNFETFKYSIDVNSSNVSEIYFISSNGIYTGFIVNEILLNGDSEMEVHYGDESLVVNVTKMLTKYLFEVHPIDSENESYLIFEINKS